MKRSILYRTLAYGILLLLASHFLYAQEEDAVSIHDLRSEMVLHADGFMSIRETLRLQVQAGTRMDGFTRDLPTQYKDLSGHPYKVRIRNITITRDGKLEPYTIDSTPDGIRIYIGELETVLPAGKHTYIITYQASGVVNTDTHGQMLCWPVNGDQGSIRIERAAATITLPPGIRSKEVSTAVGAMRNNGQEGGFIVKITDRNIIHAKTVRPLAPHEPFLIQLPLPEGSISNIPIISDWAQLLRRYPQLYLALLGLLVFPIYFLLITTDGGKIVKRRQELASHGPLTERISACALDFLLDPCTHKKMLFVAVVSLAVKGALRIEIQRLRDAQGWYRLYYTILKQPDESRHSDDSLTGEEQAILTALFRKSDNVELYFENDYTVFGAKYALTTAIKKVYGNRLFMFRMIPYFFGLLMVLGAALLVTLVMIDDARGTSSTQLIGSLGACGIPLLFLAITGASIWQGVFSNRANKVFSIARAAYMTAAPLFFFCVGAAIFDGFSTGLFVLLAVLLGIAVPFYQRTVILTPLGTELLAEAETFRQYLSSSDDSSDTPGEFPPITPGLFERYLPYAMAMNVGGEWYQKCLPVLLTKDNQTQYHPDWCDNALWLAIIHNPFAFTPDMYLYERLSSQIKKTRV